MKQGLITYTPKFSKKRYLTGLSLSFDKGELVIVAHVGRKDKYMVHFQDVHDFEARLKLKAL